MKLNSLFNRPLGACVAPNAPLRKCDAAGAAGAGFGFLGTMANVISQQETNRSNRINTIRTNEANERINQEQLAWAREQYYNNQTWQNYWNNLNRQWQLEDTADERRYNTPEAMKERYLAAGINPYLAMQGGSGNVGSVAARGQTGSLGSVTPNMIPMQSPHDVPVDYGSSFNSVGESLDRMYQMSIRERELKLKAIDVLKDYKGDPETKNKMINDLAFSRDRWTDLVYQQFEDQVWQERSKALIEEANAKIANDQNDFMRWNWDETRRRAPKEFAALEEEVAQLIREGEIQKIDFSMKETEYKILQEQYEKLKRRSDLWKGEFSWRAFLELLSDLFDSNLTQSLIGLAGRRTSVVRNVYNRPNIFSPMP